MRVVRCSSAADRLSRCSRSRLSQQPSLRVNSDCLGSAARQCRRRCQLSGSLEMMPMASSTSCQAPLAWPGSSRARSSVPRRLNSVHSWKPRWTTARTGPRNWGDSKSTAGYGLRRRRGKVSERAFERPTLGDSHSSRRSTGGFHALWLRSRWPPSSGRVQGVAADGGVG